MQNAIQGLGQVAITVSHVPTALAFYRDQLGLTFLFSPSDELAFLSTGNVRIMLTQPQGGGQINGNSVLYFSVADIQTTYAEFVSRGAKPERQPALTAKMPDHELWMGFLRDPDGNLVGVMEEVR